MNFIQVKNHSASKWLFYLLPTLLFIYGCGKKNSPSEIEWGHLENMHSRLIELPPNSTITTCGYKSDLIAESVRVWAKSIGRDAYLNINSNCQASGARLIRGISPTESDPSSMCSGNVAAYTNGQYIKFCKEYSQDLMINISLHEVGHGWGLCDQYDDGMNCDPEHRGPTDPRSVMGAAQGNLELTADDIEGIKALSEREDIPANAVWKRFLVDPSFPSF